MLRGLHPPCGPCGHACAKGLTRFLHADPAMQAKVAKFAPPSYTALLQARGHHIAGATTAAPGGLGGLVGLLGSRIHSRFGSAMNVRDTGPVGLSGLGTGAGGSTLSLKGVGAGLGTTGGGADGVDTPGNEMA